jgi:hypothetical protein
MQFLIPSVLVLIGMTQPVVEEKDNPPKEEKFQLEGAFPAWAPPI